ncbi:Mitochondrial 2-oxoadipate and 2-oxoglutarate transporter [Scheffersomyces spartinae]|uniref:Ornithine decarboxylase n=1 Tax=Scheffersomyces spartinae TaxID=45513 RepID=A0A9P7VDC7_9ASCO|nr:Mitochondrial 2-oxoadipate and 2-oxoglutarate transporter [Scheffersomyces spartinae]KAG7195727.1 Mitochondrial 2-oxoadipate and 2-oxoglutarate transporter [Scheffersomyces spartinae]
MYCFDAPQQNPNTNHGFVGNALKAKINDIDHINCEAGDEDSFFVCDLGLVKRAHQIWTEMLPMVQPHYAVKCNTDSRIISTLANLGCNFDCASKAEIESVLLQGISANRIVYANPCKTNSFIRFAKTVDVNLTTVDNCNELHKMKQFHPECGILIRLATDDESAQCRLSTKFGCTVESAVDELLPLAQELGLPIVGVAFHVGSGAKDFGSIYKAVQDARMVFDIGHQLGFKMNILDIGGGFEVETFEESSAMVRMSLEKFFPNENEQVKFIAEPGRFMVSNAFTLATHVIAKRDLPRHFVTDDIENGVKAMIYINDGVYGNLNCILFDHQHPIAHVLTHRDNFYYNGNDAHGKGKHGFSIWGPTCDGLDCVSVRSELGFDVDVGDWLYFPNLGAYTSAATTSFNGFKAVADVIYVDSTL